MPYLGEAKRHFPGEEAPEAAENKRHFPGEAAELAGEKRHFPGEVKPWAAGDKRSEAENDRERRMFYPGGMPPGKRLLQISYK